MKKPVFCGSATAVVTPFSGGAVDYFALERLLLRQIDSGADALVVCGTTGEASTLSSEEQADGVHTELALICAVYAEDRLIVVVCECRVLDVAAADCYYRHREWLEWFWQHFSDCLRLCQVSYVCSFLASHV